MGLWTYRTSTSGTPINLWWEPHGASATLTRMGVWTYRTITSGTATSSHHPIQRPEDPQDVSPVTHEPNPTTTTPDSTIDTIYCWIKCFSTGVHEPKNGKTHTLSLSGQANLRLEKTNIAATQLRAAYDGLLSKSDDIPYGRRRVILSQAIKRLIELASSRDETDQVDEWQSRLDNL